MIFGIGLYSIHVHGYNVDNNDKFDKNFECSIRKKMLGKL